MKKFEIEIELALPDAEAGCLQNAQLPSGFSIDDRRDNGWGYVLQCDGLTSESVQEAIRLFVAPLMPWAPLLTSFRPIMRVAIYNANLTCTVTLDRYDELQAIGARLEISVYPCDY